MFTLEAQRNKETRRGGGCLVRAEFLGYHAHGSRGQKIYAQDFSQQTGTPWWVWNEYAGKV